MDVRLLVALPALSRCSSIRLVCMAIFTLCRRVLTFQREEGSMGEITQPVNTIMAHHALSAKLQQVIRHKSRIILVMAINASLSIRYVQVFWMAGGADGRLIQIIRL